jgi:hypothetical protein
MTKQAAGSNHVQLVLFAPPIPRAIIRPGKRSGMTTTATFYSGVSHLRSGGGDIATGTVVLCFGLTERYSD